MKTSTGNVTIRFCFVLVLGSFFTCSVFAQTSNNLIKAYKAQTPQTNDLSTVNNKDQVSETTVYFDGLGRESQTIGKQQSPAGKDVVMFSTYDQYGRETVSYLPYISTESNGNLKSNPSSDQASYYQGLFGSTDGAAAYSKQVLEHSELARVREQGTPGAAWQTGTSHSVKKDYIMNASEEVIMFNYNPGSGDISVTPGQAMYFQSNTLLCNKTIDEQQNDVLEFVDKEGRTLCKKTKAGTGVYASTYYIYDPTGNLVVVIPPEGVKSITELLNQQ